MTSAQNKFFRLLQAWVDDEELELVVNRSFSNQGILMIQEPGSFDTLIKLPFSFQTDRASFGWMGGDKPTSRGDTPVPVFQETGRNPYFALFNPEELDDAIRMIMQWALAHKKAPA